jgi:hypothetical protein
MVGMCRTRKNLSSLDGGKPTDGLSEFETYIRNHPDFIPNFGGATVSAGRSDTAFVESTINPVVGRRFGNMRP